MSLKINDLSKHFDDKAILESFSYSFGDTGLYLIEGESGIGKTTLLRLIAGLDTDYRGEILGGGVKNISYCFQEHRLFPNLSALDNVLAILKEKSEEKEQRAISLLLSLRLENDDLSLLPNELSGGMKQRVSIARALMKNAPILLLDEPLKELDPELCDTVLDIIRQEAKRRLVLMVSHSQLSDLIPEATVIEL